MEQNPYRPPETPIAETASRSLSAKLLAGFGISCSVLLLILFSLGIAIEARLGFLLLKDPEVLASDRTFFGVEFRTIALCPSILAVCVISAVGAAIAIRAWSMGRNRQSLYLTTTLMVVAAILVLGLK